MVSLKYLTDIYRTLEMLLINCIVNLILTTQTANYVTSLNTNANQAIKFAITDLELYVPVVTLSTTDHAKLLQLWILELTPMDNDKSPENDSKRFIKNWQPVSLLNVEMKLILKVLTSRLKSLISTIVNEN